ncbi:hypothetical protein GLE_1053 [Lysobacter enzymogenes]|uniref:Uncharacterized protein n=1 Tax=Lysobacter enzymogenes TaxID=69 RepID=A0A0S2DCZ4_LYSEN|nr:hypothetical protein GLE_1053 [Lysobacter enzymogenes]
MRTILKSKAVGGAAVAQAACGEPKIQAFQSFRCCQNDSGRAFRPDAFRPGCRDLKQEHRA